ncbi:hypothetical protein ACFSQD_11735 [Flavihumibacter stibioxidans]|uniref:hypothetical protein n=1 Tax=Flavihumibacter stibioxidans TaxID=1834163 RepID=UPI0016503A0F|nr:hypothetical protein [Flavihumibacter stibioxidans]
MKAEEVNLLSLEPKVLFNFTNVENHPTDRLANNDTTTSTITLTGIMGDLFNFFGND